MKRTVGSKVLSRDRARGGAPVLAIHRYGAQGRAIPVTKFIPPDWEYVEVFANEVHVTTKGEQAITVVFRRLR